MPPSFSHVNSVVLIVCFTSVFLAVTMEMSSYIDAESSDDDVYCDSINPDEVVFICQFCISCSLSRCPLRELVKADKNMLFSYTHFVCYSCLSHQFISPKNQQTDLLSPSPRSLCLSSVVSDLLWTPRAIPQRKKLKKGASYWYAVQVGNL